MNAIVENILNLSRRERSRPEELDLARWVFDFIEEYRHSRHLDEAQLRAVCDQRHVWAIADPQQLHQVVTNLVDNALAYGRLPNQPAQVIVAARLGTESGAPLLEVVDRGPGIPPRVAAEIFEPFYTTHEHGTGLGLYIARQLCEANQAMLEHVDVPAGGSCFRVSFARPQSLSEPAAALERIRRTQRAGT